jgi:circadian clock protein KaiC
MHLATMHKLVQQLKPELVVVDPISNFVSVGGANEVSHMLVRLMDFLKSNGITSVLSNLTSLGEKESTDIGVSSIVDTWMLLRDIELNGERNRGMHILKSRGMAHSNQVREFLLTDEGIQLRDVYVGPEGVLAGSSRLAQEAKAAAAALVRRQEVERRQRQLERKRNALEAQIATLRSEFEQEEEEIKLLIGQEEAREVRLDDDRDAMTRSRQADSNKPPATPARSRQ